MTCDVNCLSACNHHHVQHTLFHIKHVVHKESNHPPLQQHSVGLYRIFRLKIQHIRHRNIDWTLLDQQWKILLTKEETVLLEVGTDQANK